MATILDSTALVSTSAESPRKKPPLNGWERAGVSIRMCANGSIGHRTLTGLLDRKHQQLMT